MTDSKQIVKPPVPMGSRGLVPTDIDSLQRLATMIAASPFAPGSFKDATSIAVCIDFGMSVGLSPLQALQNVAVINGKPSLFGDGLIGVVRASGLCAWIKEGIDGSGENAVGYCETQRAGEPEPVKRTYSVTDAKTAGLWGKAGPWKQYPARMLMLRARGFCLRDVYADVLKGFISADEARDIPGEQASALENRIVDSTAVPVDDSAPTEIVIQEYSPAPEPEAAPPGRGGFIDASEIDRLADEKPLFGGSR